MISNDIIIFETFDTLYALNSFENYWSENEALIKKAADEQEVKNGPKWVPKGDEELPEYFMEVDMARHLHDKIISPTFRYSCIVTLYAIIDRELRRCIENLEKKRGPQKLKVNDIRGQSYFLQVAKYLETFFELRLANCQQYEAICDLQKIRDCIIHCRGEVNLSRDAKYLVELKDRRPGFFAWEGADIEILPECIERFINETWDFFVWLFGQLKWKIDDSFMGRKRLTAVPSRN